LQVFVNAFKERICKRKEGGRGGIKVYPPSKFFAKLVNKNAIKNQKGVTSPQNFHNPYIPSLPKFCKNLIDPPSGFSNRVHLWVITSSSFYCITQKILKIKHQNNVSV
jgi:hypothetical protein